ncbi:MAG: hypothetical protein U9R04_03775 [Chloroflexota bacterium]|nr:hypothetical protein [Chloroflexota bacterium]
MPKLALAMKEWRLKSKEYLDKVEGILAEVRMVKNYNLEVNYVNSCAC